MAASASPARSAKGASSASLRPACRRSRSARSTPTFSALAAVVARAIPPRPRGPISPKISATFSANVPASTAMGVRVSRLAK